ncbi:MAG TPA: nucleotide disphospho-sugar-binding domain-containing protein [Pseudonocardiaceae bacterium]
MRVLFVTWAWPSHLYSLVPLAWACRAAGHEVLLASQPALAEETARTGLPGASVGRDVDAVGLVRGYLLGAANEPRKGGGPRAMEMFHAHADSMVDELIELAKGFRPDLVVYEPTALAGALAAAAIGVPGVRLLYGTDLMLRAKSVLPEVLAPLAARNGVTEFDPYGAVTIDPTPPRLRAPSDRDVLGMRYLAYNGSGEPRRLAKANRPRICVTWGHTIAKIAPGRFLLPKAVDAVQGLGAEVVVAISSAQQHLVGNLPADVRVFVDAPLAGLVDGCDLVIAHGGAGTVLTSVSKGVPMLLVPQLPDHAGHAAHLAGTGAAELVPWELADRARLREDAQHLLASTEAKTAAAELGEEINGQPTPAALVERLAEISG